MSNKIRVKTHHVVKHDYHESVKHLVEQQQHFINGMDAKMKELVGKHNEMAAALQASEKLTQNVVTMAVTEVGKLQARLDVIAGECDRALTGIDRNVLALAEITKEVFGQLVQADSHMKKLATFCNISLELSEDEMGVLRTDAEKWYRDTTASAFDVVQKRFVAMEQERMMRETAAQIAKEEAEKSAQDKEEADRIGQELRKAEEGDKSVFMPPGGRGSSIPEGADVFGGDYATGG